MTKRTRRKIDAALKAKIALEAQEGRAWSIWPSDTRLTRTRCIPASGLGLGGAAFEAGAGSGDAGRERETEGRHTKAGLRVV
jgi:hypothetical protein